MTDDPYITIHDRMDPADAAIFMERVILADPSMDGATVPDVLCLYDETDALLGVRQPFYGANRDLFENVDQHLINAAVIAAAVLRPDEMRPVVEQLMENPDDPSDQSYEQAVVREADALEVMKQIVERSQSPLIYLHDPAGGKPFAALVPEGPMLTAAEAGMVQKGWNIYDHDHRDGDA